MATLRSFLKKHSAIPNAFIDSFLSMYDADTVQTDYVINCDNAAKWLGVEKYVLLRTLKETYKQGIDYIETQTTKRKGKYGGNNYKLVMLTPDCFKRVCMRSRSKKAEEVRTYFIQLESLLVRYKSFIIEGMDREMKSMERSLKPKTDVDGVGYVYVVKASPDKDSVYKIGRSGSLRSRLSTYGTGTIDGVEVLFRFRTDNYKAVERCVKAWLKEHRYRKYKEVYQANLDMIKGIVQGCDEIGMLKKEYVSTKAPVMKGGYYIWLAEGEGEAEEED